MTKIIQYMYVQNKTKEWAIIHDYGVQKESS